jgi:outer membrane protein assembly factor BamB
MKSNFTEKDINVLKIISQIAGGFTILVSLTMIFSFVQLKTINPLDNPVLLQVKEQYDKDPSNAQKAEQVRAMDLMARKAYFSSRWQVESGAYLLIAGAVIFVFCQRLIAGNEKLYPVLAENKPDNFLAKKKNRMYLISAGAVISLTAFGASFLLRNELPDPYGKSGVQNTETTAVSGTLSEPDKINYPFFRGENSQGIAGGKNYPLEWNGTDGKNILWKTEIPKSGQSSPVIWEDKIFLTGAENKICEVYCIDKKTGKLLWTGSASGIAGEPAEDPKTDQETGLAASTAATNGKYVCAAFANGNLVCFDLDGNKKWSLSQGLPESSYGYSSSLLIYNDLLIVQYDSEKKISLIGYDLETGNVKWETMRTGRPVWSSPVLAYFDNKPQVIVNGNPNVTSFDAVTGTELWSVECLTGDVAPSLAFNSSMVYAVTDYARLAAVKPGTGASIAWQDNSFTPDVASPVANEKFLFIATGNGDIACYNALKGDTVWTHYFLDQFYASPIIAGENVYLLDRSGVMHIISAGDKFKIVSEPSIGEEADCTPAFSDKKIYIRGKKNLYCIAEN